MHQEVLVSEGRTLFPFLKKFVNFYLAGGTALALQIGHRVSVDFDLFSSERIPNSLLSEVKSIFAKREIAVSVDNQDELTVFIDGVKLTFLYYPYPPKKLLDDFGGLRILGQKEIAATKAYTIGRRGSLKDYVDLYYILVGKISTLEDIIMSAKEKYGSDFNSRLFLEQLIYLDDVEETEIIFLKDKVSKKELLKFFSNEIKNLRL